MFLICQAAKQLLNCLDKHDPAGNLLDQERGNLVHRLQNGAHAHFTWDLFDRLASYSDDKLKVDFAYDALGRRLYKNSVAHYWDRPEAGACRTFHNS